MTYAFIPVRGGSKSIPLKNIKPFCGRPLVWWSVSALQDCPRVDRIVVATDSDEIAAVAASFGFSKTEIYRRSARNASDTASTESAMLEYIDSAGPRADDTFMLVQATSPLTQTADFDGALRLYGTGRFDSVLSCVRCRRFFWNADGTPHNYDYRRRPRRQEFDGMFMENGAFYISSVGNILRDGNRLSGKIGVYEMAGDTAAEIDEPDDWIILEALMRRRLENSRAGGGVPGAGGEDFSGIRLVISDVDGVLTDGGMYYSESGDEQKKFDTRDGMAFQILRERGIRTAIITGESTRLVERRSAKIGADFLIQGRRGGGKLEAARKICSELRISLAEAAYIGDDIGDIELLEAVGFPFCPNDAQEEVLRVRGIHRLTKNGGAGAVREMARTVTQW